MDKTIHFYPAFDKRHPDPKQNYGIGGVTIQFILKGELGAVDVVFGTKWYLPEIQIDLFHKDKYFEVQPTGSGLWYHSPIPNSDGQEATHDCNIIGDPCYSGVTFLGSDPYRDALLAGGSDAVWRKLEEYYVERLGELR